MKRIKKGLVVCLSALFVLFSVIPAVAASPVQLDKSNIAEAPVIEGEIYFSQKLGDQLSLTGGKVTVDGQAESEEIPGVWSLYEPDVTAGVGMNYVKVKFTPTDETAYLGFELTEKADLRTYSLYLDAMAAPMHFEGDEYPVVTATASGDRWNTVTIDNPPTVVSGLTGEPLEVKWTFDRGGALRQGGYYQARVYLTGYAAIRIYVYVRLPGDESQPLVSKFPTIDPADWHEGMRVKDLELKGGESIVPGDFVFTEPEKELTAGTTSVSVSFVPEDGSDPLTITISVKVTPAELMMEGEDGQPEPLKLRLQASPRRYSQSDIQRFIKSIKLVGDVKIESVTIATYRGFTFTNYQYDLPLDKIGLLEGCTFTVSFRLSNSNYKNFYTLPIEVIPQKIQLRMESVLGKEYTYQFGYVDYIVPIQGLFEIVTDGQPTGQTFTFHEQFVWKPEKSGHHKLELIYHPVENDPAEILPIEPKEGDFALNWKLDMENCAIPGTKNTSFACGTSLTIETLSSLPYGRFDGWKFYDANGKEVADVEIVNTSDDSAAARHRITILMPDHDLKVVGVDKRQSGQSGGDSDDPLLCFTSFIERILNFFDRLLTFLSGIFTA